MTNESAANERNVVQNVQIFNGKQSLTSSNDEHEVIELLQIDAVNR